MGLKFDVEIDGESREVDLDLSLSTFTLKESIRLEEAIGEQKFASLMDGREITPSPRMIQALIWTKLATLIPGVGMDDFDLDLGDIAEVWKAGNATAEVIEMPMQTPDGEEVTTQIKEAAQGNA